MFLEVVDVRERLRSTCFRGDDAFFEPASGEGLKSLAFAHEFLEETSLAISSGFFPRFEAHVTWTWLRGFRGGGRGSLSGGSRGCSRWCFGGFRWCDGGAGSGGPGQSDAKDGDQETCHFLFKQIETTQ